MPILSTTFLTSAPSLSQCPEQTSHEFAFIWRSNVGKSTLINTICNNKSIAKVSGKPGKTQLLNYFTVISSRLNRTEETGTEDEWGEEWALPEMIKKERTLVDLPWYWYARVSRKERNNRQGMVTEFLRRRPLTMIYVLIDCSVWVQDIDIEFMVRLENKRIIYKIVFTKSDKNNQKQQHAHLKLFTKACNEHQIELPDYFIVNQKKPKSIMMLVEDIEGMVE